MISIFYFLKHEKDAIFLMKICLENFLGFGLMHENKTFIFVFFMGKLI
jgi:hypothetical protein